MLLFISFPSLVSKNNLFQYISCYSLSKSFWNNSMESHSFNTSHVTLYHYLILNFTTSLKFQYISCYSLSYYRSWMGRFKYVSIHLMLLFIGSRLRERRSDDRVSIHLMLLFIRCGIYAILQIIKFQYISCYSLSKWIHLGHIRSKVSIHLMLLFIYNH